MSVKRKKMHEILSGNKGFTLIEMAIVLIIIGIIIGAVVKGKDVIRSAEQKKIYTKLLNAWELSYNSYYDRTGWILHDTATLDNSGIRDGHCTPVVDPKANLVAQLKAVGIDVPTKGAAGNENERKYTDSQGRSYDLIVVFDYRAAIGNFMRIRCTTNGIATELGMAWDRIIDGQRDGTEGDMLYTANYTVDPIVFAPWLPATDDPVVNSAAILKLSF